MNRRKIYLAAPLFNKFEQQRNSQLKLKLDKLFNIFMPQEDGLLLVDLIANGTDPKVARKKIFDLDMAALKSADILVAILDGAVIDPGVAVEIGVFSALNKPCYGLQTDIRRQILSGNNPMIDGALTEIFLDDDLLVKFLLTKYAES